MNEIIAAPPLEFKKPWYTLELIATGVGIDARVNDIHIDQDAYGGNSTTEFEVATSIIDGINELKIIIYPYFIKSKQTENYHAESEVKATLYVREKDDPDGKKYILSHIHINPNLPPEQMTNNSAIIDGVEPIKLDIESNPLAYPKRVIKQQIVATRKTLPIKSKYPRWAWQDGQNIEDSEENYNSLLTEYKNLHDAFSKRDMNTLLAIHVSRSRENALAYYLGDSEEAGHKFMSTGEILNDPGAQLYKFSTNLKKLDIFADGKIARIIDKALYHPVLFFDPEKELIHTMKYGFYKNKSGEWIMIR